jgi:hypothetical protein
MAMFRQQTVVRIPGFFMGFKKYKNEHKGVGWYRGAIKKEAHSYLAEE